MPGDTTGVWGTAHDTGDYTGVLGTPMNHTHGRVVVWGGIHSYMQGHVERLHLNYDIQYCGGKVVKDWIGEVCDPEVSDQGPGYTVEERDASLYENDGRISIENVGWVQQSFGTLVDMFERVRLQANVNKT